MTTARAFARAKRAHEVYAWRLTNERDDGPSFGFGFYSPIKGPSDLTMPLSACVSPGRYAIAPKDKRKLAMALLRVAECEDPTGAVEAIDALLAAADAVATAAISGTRTERRQAAEAYRAQREIVTKVSPP